jgi:hypothetical protein
MSESELKIIEALARYKFLTTSQLDYLNILKNKVGLYARLRGLRVGKKPYIRNNIFGIMPGKGRLEDFYFLDKKGKDFLIEHLDYSEDKIKIPKGRSTLFQRDYFHRKRTIDFFLYFDRFLLQNENSHIIFLDYYFDKIGDNRKGKNLQAKNKIEIEETGGGFIPDIITKFRYKNEPYLFFIEQHNGKDTKKLMKQLYYHLLAIEQGAGAEKYQINKSHRVVVVFEFESILKATIERLGKIEDFKGFEKFFIFKTSQSLKSNFFDEWIDIDNQLTKFI